MSAPDQDLGVDEAGREASDQLIGACAALRLAQQRFADELAQTVGASGEQGSDAPLSAILRRFQEQLALIQLQLARIEWRLDQAMAGLIRSGSALRDAVPERAREATLAELAPSLHGLRVRIETWCDRRGLPTVYRRLDTCLDLDGDAVNADLATDLCLIAETIAVTLPGLDRLAARRVPAQPEREDLAFFRILAPWRTVGGPALRDTLRVLAERLAEDGDW